MREGEIINVNCRMFAIFIGRLRTVMTRLAAIIGILIAKAKTDGPRQKYGSEQHRHKISGTTCNASNSFYDFHSMELYHKPPTLVQRARSRTHPYQPMRHYAVYVPLCVKAIISNLFYTLRLLMLREKTTHIDKAQMQT
jgi:hypothetical protein